MWFGLSGLLGANKHMDKGVFRNPRLYILVVSGLAIFINYVYYAYSLSFNMPAMDQWYWIKGVLIPYADGDMSLYQAITSEFETLSHSHILTLSSIIFSYHFFELNFVVLSCIGHVGFVVGMIYLIKNIVLPDVYIKNISASIMLIAIFSLLFTISSKNIFANNLLSFEQFYLGASLIAATLVLNAKQGVKGAAVVFFVAIFTLTLGDGMGIVTLLSLISVYVFSALVDKSGFWKLGILAGSLFLMVIVSAIFPIDSRSHGGGVSGFIPFVVKNPSVMLESINVISSRVFFDVATIRRVSDDEYAVIKLVASLSSLSIILYSYWIYFSKKLYRDNYLPLFLLIFTIVAAAGVVINRVPKGGADYLRGGRYLRLYVMAGVGALFVLYVHLATAKANSIRFIYALIAMLVITLQIKSTYDRWKYIQSQVNYAANMVHQAGLYADGRPNKFASSTPPCRNDHCKDAVLFLKNNHLSFFAGHNE